MKIAELNKILETQFKDKIKLTKDVPEGPSYILRNGSFLYYDIPEYTYHAMEQEFLSQYISNDELNRVRPYLWPFIKYGEVFIVNDGLHRTEECVIRLPMSKPSQAQYEALERWIDNLITKTGFIYQLQVTDMKSVSNFVLYDMKDPDINTKYIIERIKLYYVEGKLLP